jgi:hypothetical protein
MDLDTTDSEDKSSVMKNGQKELLDAFNIWSAGLSRHSVQAVYAIIAANWATHVQPNKPILTDTLATWSMGICIAFIVVNIILTGILTELNRDRWREAEDKTESWILDFNNRNDKQSKWPYTNKIENYGAILRFIRVIIPLIAGSLFLISLF